jgi:hypothetical protein
MEMNTASVATGETDIDRCAKCSGMFLYLDSQVVLWSEGRLVRLACRLCGWDAHLGAAEFLRISSYWRCWLDRA